MAEDPRSQADTNNVPEALESFLAERAVRREEPTVAVSRAAALLSLVRPGHVEDSEYRLATQEPRELLGVEPVEPFELGRERLVTELDELGEAGARAARLLRYEPSGRGITDEPGAEAQGEGASRRIMRDLGALSEPERDTVDAAQRDAATQLFRAEPADRDVPRHDPAARLIAASLLDEDPLVQVAAAAAALRIDRRNPVAEAILDKADREESDEIAELSRAILTGDRQTEVRVIEIEYPAGVPDPAADSTLVHGTWARSGRWWQPDGKLHRYLRDDESLFPHLYRGPDPFKWSGYFSFRVWPKPKEDWNRQQAADSLAWWTYRKLKPDPDLIGHSYGASLSMMATQAEKKVRGMVLLSPAVHRTCLPDPANYQQILHVTTKLDLVLLADLSTPLLLRSLPNVTEWPVTRKGLTGHGATHDPRVWRESGLTDYVRNTWLPSLTPRR
jgi:hypothetical protein